MELSAITQLWQPIREEWQGVTTAFRPWGLWITYHAPPIVDSGNVVLPIQTVRRAWFCERMMDVPQEKSTSMFFRFWIMQRDRSWDHTGCASPDPWFSINYHAIARASFACLTDSRTIYLETMWAGLYGRGQYLTRNADGFVQPLQTVWVS